MDDCAKEYVRAEGPAFEMLGCAGIGLALMSREGAIVAVNESLCRLLARDAGELVGRQFAELAGDDDRDEIAASIHRIAEGNVAEVTILARYAMPNGEPRVGRTSLMLYDDHSDHEPCVAALVQDVTQLKSASELATLLSCLRHEQRVHEQFVADVAHDLRTPLTVLSAELELLHEHVEGDRDSRRMVKRAINELRRVDHLAGNLLMISRLDAHRPPSRFLSVALDQLALEALELYAVVSAQKGINWKIDVDERIDVLGEEAALRRAITNLIDNAVKYLPPGGTIELRLEREEEMAVLSVIDDGPGIPEDEIDYVCERYYRGALARDKPGTGLGLAIVRSVATAHGGRLMIDSRPEGGTDARILIPVERTGV